jgi:hypothetical protein
MVNEDTQGVQAMEKTGIQIKRSEHDDDLYDI